MLVSDNGSYHYSSDSDNGSFMQKVGRNSPCPCGSGKKFKKCCGHPVTGKDALRQDATRRADYARRMMDAHAARELIRERQQGKGKPIISGELAGRRIVAVGNTIYHSKKWKVFPDFLSDYLKKVMGPLDEQHTLLHWYRAYCAWQASAPGAASGAVKNMQGTGAVWCYIGLAYSLYLIKHNVELEARLLKRLRDPDPRQFQGAYYELVVANLLIRAGFELTLEDEQDNDVRHCEFSAVAPGGQKYWVEAKMRTVAGVFGVTKEHGGSTRTDPTEKLTDHLRKAFQKPATGPRFIFIDVNAPGDGQTPPAWCDRAGKKLEQSAQSRDGNHSAYVFVTNMNFHHHPTETRNGSMVMAYGYGIDDFEKAGHWRFSEVYRRRQKHRDAMAVMDSFSTYTTLPTTFDGAVPSDMENPEEKIVIGEKYLFGDPGNEFLAEVTSAIVTEDKEMVLGVVTEKGEACLLKGPATDQQLADYLEHGEAYFGKPRRTKTKTDDIYDFFLWILENFKGMTKEKMLAQAQGAPDIEHLASLSREDRKSVV